MKIKMYVVIKRMRAVSHLDPTSALHVADRTTAKVTRKRTRAERIRYEVFHGPTFMHCVAYLPRRTQP